MERSQSRSRSWRITTRRAGFVIVICLAALAFAGQGAQATDIDLDLTNGVDLIPSSDPSDLDELNLSQTWDQVEAFVQGHDPIHIPLAFIPQLQQISIDAVTISVSDDLHAIAIRGDGTLQGKPISAMLTADWDQANAGDSSPDVALGVKFTDVQLSFLNPAWTDLGDGVPPTLSRAWVVFTNASGVLDVTTLPQVASDFYELSAPPQGDPVPVPGNGEDDRFELFPGANFRGFLDLNLYPALRKGLAFHGVQTQDILIEGHLAATAALLFGAAQPDDLAGLDLSVAIETTGADPPPWLTKRSLSVELTLGPGPVITFGDTIDTLVGGAANRFTQSVAFDPTQFGGSGPIEITGTFDVDGALEHPYGIHIGDLSLELTVDVDLGASPVITGVDAALLADLDVGAGTVGVRAELQIDGANVTVHFVLENDVSLGDVVDAFSAAVGLPSFGTSSFGDLTLDTVSFDVARVGGNTKISLGASLGAWNDVFGLTWMDLQDLTVSLALADGELGGPHFQEPRLTASVTSLFDIGGIDATLSVGAEGVDGGLKATVRASLADGDVVPIGDALDFVGQQFGASPDLGSVFSGLDLDGLSLTVSVDTDGVVTFDILASADVPHFPGASLYVSVSDPSSGLSFFAGVRPNGPVSVGDIVPIPGLGSVQLPDLGLVLATAPVHVTAAGLTPEGFNFMKPLFGCDPDASQPGTGGSGPVCDFPDLTLDQGISMLANIQMPHALDPLTQSLWMNPADGLQFVGTVPFPDFGGAQPTAFGLQMLLPTVDPPDTIDMIESGRLAIGVEFQFDPSPSISLFVRGELQTRWRRSTDPQPPGEPCQLGTLMAGIDQQGNDQVEHQYCYDRLTFTVESAVTLSPTDVELTLLGGLQATDGLWEQPFGVEWLSIRTLRLKFGVAYSIPTASLSFKVGFLGDVLVNDKELVTSLSVGLQITPFPPPPPPAAPLITPTFLGFRGYVSSLGTADLVELQRMFTGGADPLRVDALPDVEVRNAEVMFALESDPDLCLEQGLGVAGEVFIDGEPAGDTEVPRDPDSGCLPFGSQVDPGSCAKTGPDGRRDEGCFASFFGKVSLEGIVADGSIGSIDLGPVHFEDARLDFELKPSVQKFVLSGGVTVDGLGAGQLSVAVGAAPPQLTFFGRLETFGLFFAQVDGSLSVALEPPFDPVGSVRFHAALEAEFQDQLGTKLEDLVAGRMQALQNQLQPVLEFWQTIIGSNAGNALGQIADVFELLGQDVPEWAAPLEDAADAAIDLANAGIDLYGHGVPHIHRGDLDLDVLLDGGNLQIDVGKARDDDPRCDFGAVEAGGRCVLLIPIPSFGDFLDSIGLGGIFFPSSFSEFMTDVEATLGAGISDLAELDHDIGLGVSAFFGRLADLLSDVHPLSVDCAEFSFDAGTDTGTEVQLQLAITVLGQRYGVNPDWDFSGDGFGSIDGMFHTLVDQYFGTPGTVTCLGAVEPPGGIHAPTACDPELQGDPLSGSATFTGDGGNWSDKNNWDPPIVPTGMACIPAGKEAVFAGPPGSAVIGSVAGGGTLRVLDGRLTLTSTSVPMSLRNLVMGGGGSGELRLPDAAVPAKVENLTLDAGVLRGSQDLTVATFSFDGGIYVGTGTTTVTGTLNVLAPNQFHQPNMWGRSLAIAHGARATFHGGAALAMALGSRIDNAGDLYLEDAISIDNVGDPGTFTNTGTVYSTGTPQIAVPFDNEGTLWVTSGTLSVFPTLPSGPSVGSFHILGGAALRFYGGIFNLGASSSVSGAGSFVATGSSRVTVNGAFAPRDTQISGGNLTLNTDATLATVTLVSGTLAGSGNLTVTGTFAWHGGIHDGAATTTVSGHLVVDAPSGVILGRRDLVIPQGANGTIAGNGMSLSLGAAIDNAGDLEITGDVSIRDVGSAGTFTNTGTLTRNSGTGTFSVGTYFDNLGTLSLLTGTFDLGWSNAGSYGSFQLGAGTTLHFSGGIFHFAPGSSISGAGSFTVAGGRVTVDGTYAPGDTQISGGNLVLNTDTTMSTVTLLPNGTLSGSGNLTVTGTFAWHGGTQGDGATTTVTGQLIVDAPSGVGLRFRHLVIPEGATGSISAGGMALALGASIDNAGGLQITGNPSISDGGSAGTFTNTGTITRSSGTGTASIGTYFDNLGSVSVQTGTFDIAWSNVASSGSFQIGTGTTLRFSSGKFRLGASSSVSGPGSVVVTGQVTVDGAYAPADTRVSGSLALNADATLSAVTLLPNGNLSGTGHLTVTGTFAWHGGNHVGSGTTTVSGQLVLDSPSAVTMYGRDLVIADGASAVLSGGGMSLALGARIDNAGDLQIEGNTSIAGDSSEGTFTNTGTITRSSGTGTASIGMRLANPGTLSVQTGTLDITRPFANYNVSTHVLTGGTYEVAGILRFNSADIVTNQAAIELDGPSSAIRDIANNDALRNLATNGASGRLAVTNGRNLVLPHALSSAGALAVGSGSTLTTPSVTMTGGTLSGDGTVAAPVLNSAGTVLPGSSPGTLSIAGTYTQGAAGGLTVDVAGTDPGTDFDVLQVGGAATLDGTLTIVTAPGFTPDDRQAYPILAAASRSGTFASIVGADLGNGTSYDTTYGPTGVTLDVQGPPAISIDDLIVDEGDSGTTAATFVVTLSKPGSAVVQVDYATADGTAQSPGDYVATSGTLTFAPGLTSQLLIVDVVGDTILEPDETFSVDLSNPANATIADAQGVGTIVDDDTAAPVVTGFKPAARIVGKKVAILGSGFTGATEVDFAKAGGGTVKVTTFASVTDTKISVKVPKGATTGTVSVTTPSGTGTSAGDFKVRPKVEKFSPPSGPVGTLVTIKGTSFTGATAVAFGAMNAPSFTVVSDDRITVTVPLGAVSGTISITTPGGTAVSKGTFTVI